MSKTGQPTTVACIYVPRGLMRNLLLLQGLVYLLCISGGDTLLCCSPQIDRTGLKTL